MPRVERDLPDAERCQALSTPSHRGGSLMRCRNHVLRTIELRDGSRRACTVHARMHAANRFVPWGELRDGWWYYGAEPRVSAPPGANGAPPEGTDGK
jgi:hypothetical protein